MIDIKELRKGLAAVKDALRALEDRAMDLRLQRDAIEVEPPHPGDIAAWIQRGLDQAQRSFDERMRRYFSEAFIRNQRGSFTVTVPPPQLVGLPALWSDRGRPDGGMHDVLADREGAADIATLTVLLRPAIEAQIPHLVETYFPAANGRMTAAERLKKIADIDAQIAECERQMQEARANLQEISETVMA